MLSVIELVLSLLSTTLAQATQSKLPEEVITGIEDAIASLNAVQNTPVTFAQLESIRVKPSF